MACLYVNEYYSLNNLFLVSLCFRFYQMEIWYSHPSEQRTIAKKSMPKFIYVWQGILLDQFTPEMSTWEQVKFTLFLLRNWDELLISCTANFSVHLSQLCHTFMYNYTNPSFNIRFQLSQKLSGTLIRILNKLFQCHIP